MGVTLPVGPHDGPRVRSREPRGRPVGSTRTGRGECAGGPSEPRGEVDRAGEKATRRPVGWTSRQYREGMYASPINSTALTPLTMLTPQKPFLYRVKSAIWSCCAR